MGYESKKAKEKFYFVHSWEAHLISEKLKGKKLFLRKCCCEKKEGKMLLKMRTTDDEKKRFRMRWHFSFFKNFTLNVKEEEEEKFVTHKSK